MLVQQPTTTTDVALRIPTVTNFSKFTDLWVAETSKILIQDAFKCQRRKLQQAYRLEYTAVDFKLLAK